MICGSPGAYRSSAAACRPAVEPLHDRRQDPGRVEIGAAGCSTRCDRCLHGQRISPASGAL